MTIHLALYDIADRYTCVPGTVYLSRVKCTAKDAVRDSLSNRTLNEPQLLAGVYQPLPADQDELN
jgi:hypothetical protein